MNVLRPLFFKKHFSLIFLAGFSLIFFSHPLYASQSGKTTKAIKTAIEQLQKSKKAKTRISAAKVLGYHATVKSIEALATALVEDRESEVRGQAADSLWKHGKKGLAAQQSLKVALKDSSPSVRVSASWALQNQGVELQLLVEARRSVLDHKESSVTDRFWAAKGLIGFDPPAQLITPILQYCKSRSRSKAAESALKKFAEKKDRSIIPEIKAMAGQFHRGNTIILKGLEEFSPGVEGMVSLLCKQFSFKDNKLTVEVLMLLQRHTVDAEEVSIWLPQVKGYTADRDQTLRMHAVRLIGRAGGLAFDALPEIVRMVQSDPQANLRRDAIEAIGSMGDKTQPFSFGVKKGVATETVALLGGVIRNDPDKETRKTAVRTLAKLKTDPADVVPVFVDAAVKDDYTLVRMSALQALRAMGKDAEAAIPEISPLVEHSDPSISKNAQWAIEAIKKNSIPVSKDLQTTSKKQDAGQKQAMASLRASGTTFDERGFMLALGSINIEKVKAFLDAGISANFRFTSVHDKPALSTVFDRTAVYAMQGKPTPAKVKELVKLLLSRGADPNLTDKRGNTSLMMAAMGCDAETLQLLIDGGASPNAKSKDGISAIELTISFGNKGAAAVLVKNGARLSPSKVDSYKETYANNPAALEVIKLASP